MKHKRKSVRKSKSVRSFRKAHRRTQKVNVKRPVSRGGIRF
nr:MAG: hypothetical protein [Microviridae sp.]